MDSPNGKAFKHLIACVRRGFVVRHSMHVGVVSDVPWRSGQFDSNVVAHAVAMFKSSVFCHYGLPIPVTVQCKAWVWGLSVAGTVVSNAAGGGYYLTVSYIGAYM